MMFDPHPKPRVFSVPLGVDFPAALVDGLLSRTETQDPDALARVHVIVNTRRMARRVRDLFDAGPPRLLPKISLIMDFGDKAGLSHVPEAVPALRRRLELIQLISTLLDRQPDLAPRSALYDLADSLAGLVEEMHGEGVSPEVIDTLDISDQSGHWDRTRTFFGIVRHFFEHADSAPDPATRQRLVIEALIRHWDTQPPKDPIILAGSTGSRGATYLMMRAIARLPQGAVILPGVDRDMPDHVWEGLSSSASAEDHPQYRFQKFLAGLDLSVRDLSEWSRIQPEQAARTRLVSLALRPAPVTDQWLHDGPDLGDLISATDRITLLEAPGQRLEAQAIAMRLRKAAEDGQTAALITPDRALTRQVTAALARWGIVPDDSAGQPMHLGATGRFLRHVADLFHAALSAESLLTLLKHPLTHSGADRGPHLLLSRELELALRRSGPPFPDADWITQWAASRKEDLAQPWAAWLIRCFAGIARPGPETLSAWLDRHMALAELISTGSNGGDATLWSGDSGQATQAVIADLMAEAHHAGAMTALDYSSLLGSILSRNEVRNSLLPHPNVLIWGTLEARVQGADLTILAGLNEGSWPEAPRPDPWLNRAMRARAGLLLPERQIGLSAHDFQQALCRGDVWITRSERTDGAETVPSRWVNRLTNLLRGLPEQHGTEALAQMRARGDRWLTRVAQLEAVTPVDPAPRPSPCPPVSVRPDRLSVTEIKTLIRDPYAIYAKHVLRLRPLDPLMRTPDALLRGIVLHSVLEDFIRSTADRPDTLTAGTLLDIARARLDLEVPWAQARALWLARIGKIADWFVESELQRQSVARPQHHEITGTAQISDPAFTLTAKADRIDVDDLGYLHIYDYKTGQVPTPHQQTYFDKQLLLEAAIAYRGGFKDLVSGQVARATYIGLAGGGKEQDAPLDTQPPEKTWEEFCQLIQSFADESKGYPSRRSLLLKTDVGNYDQLARFGEWDSTNTPVEIKVGQ